MPIIRRLIDADKPVETLAVGSLLAVFNWPENSDRYNRVRNLVNAFFSRFDEFLQPGRHPKWKEVNLAADVPGWERVKPAQDWLDHMATGATGATGTQPQNFEAFLNARGASVTPAQRDSLFREFLTWQTERQKAARGGGTSELAGDRAWNSTKRFDMIGRNSSTLRLTLIAGFCVLLVASETPSPDARTCDIAAGIRASAEPPVNPDEIGSLLPLLVPLPEQKRLAAELRTLLESGDIKGASEKLTVAVEVGALAAILLDWLPYPALLTALKALPDDADAASQPGRGGRWRTRRTALTEALERERAHSAALSEELSTPRPISRARKRPASRRPRLRPP